jgi:hypothetical protein
LSQSDTSPPPPGSDRKGRFEVYTSTTANNIQANESQALQSPPQSQSISLSASGVDEQIASGGAAAQNRKASRFIVDTSPAATDQQTMSYIEDSTINTTEDHMSSQNTDDVYIISLITRALDLNDTQQMKLIDLVHREKRIQNLFNKAENRECEILKTLGLLEMQIGALMQEKKHPTSNSL